MWWIPVGITQARSAQVFIVTVFHRMPKKLRQSWRRIRCASRKNYWSFSF